MVFGVVFQGLMKKRNSCKVIEQNFISPCMCCIKCEGISSFGREQQTGIVPCLRDLPCMRDTLILMGTCSTSFFVRQRIHKFYVCTVLCKPRVCLLVVAGSLNFYFIHFSIFFVAVLEMLLMTLFLVHQVLMVACSKNIIITVYQMNNFYPSYTWLANRMCEEGDVKF